MYRTRYDRERPHSTRLAKREATDDMVPPDILNGRTSAKPIARERRMSVHVWRDMFNRLHDVVLFHAPAHSSPSIHAGSGDRSNEAKWQQRAVRRRKTGAQRRRRGVRRWFTPYATRGRSLLERFLHRWNARAQYPARCSRTLTCAAPPPHAESTWRRGARPSVILECRAVVPGPCRDGRTHPCWCKGRH